MSVPLSAIAEGLDCQGKYTMLEVADCNFYQGEGIDKIWDLTNLNLTGAKTEYELKSTGNDTLALKDTDTSYFYTFRGDTLLYLGFENRLLKVANNVGIPIAYKPLQYSRYITNDSRENTFVVSLSPGTHRVSLSFETDKDSGEIILYPLEIMGTKKEVLEPTSLGIKQ